MNIAAALNSSYVKYAFTMLTSLFVNHPKIPIHVYLIHSNLTEEDQSCLTILAESYQQDIHFLRVKPSALPPLPTCELWSLEAYYRLMLPDLLPSCVDRILYFDVDMIINKSIQDFYNIDFEEYYFCVCRDSAVSFPMNDKRDEIFKEPISQNFTYFNSGMMLWNIEALRGKYCFKDYMDLAETLNYQMVAPDQDLLNYMHWKQVKFVDEYRYDLLTRWAYDHGLRYDKVKKECSILHFAGHQKPWKGGYIHYDIEQLWWDYAKLTPFYHELMEKFLHDCLGSPLIYDTLDGLCKEKANLALALNKSVSLCQKLLQRTEEE